MSGEPELDPLSARALEVAGVALSVGRRYEEAVTAFQQALELQPGMTGALWWLSMTYQASSQHAQAVSCLRRVSKRQPACRCISLFSVVR